MGFLGTSADAEAAEAEGRSTKEKARPPQVRPRAVQGVRGAWESLVNWPPDNLPQNTSDDADRSVFLEDTSGKFKRLLLAGREFDMVLLSVVTYCMVDMATASTYTAIFVTYAIDLAVRTVRAALATANIAQKTLLDDRFLL